MVLGRRLPGRVGRRRISREKGPFGAPSSRSLRGCLRPPDRAPEGRAPVVGRPSGGSSRRSARPGGAGPVVRARRARAARSGSCGIVVAVGLRDPVARPGTVVRGRAHDPGPGPARAPGAVPAHPAGGSSRRSAPRRGAPRASAPVGGSSASVACGRRRARHARPSSSDPWPATRAGVVWPAGPPPAWTKAARAPRPPGAGRWIGPATTATGVGRSSPDGRVGPGRRGARRGRLGGGPRPAPRPRRRARATADEVEDGGPGRAVAGPSARPGHRASSSG